MVNMIEKTSIVLNKELGISIFSKMISGCTRRISIKAWEESVNLITLNICSSKNSDTAFKIF